MDLRHIELLTPRDLLEKLKREVGRFDIDRSADNLFNVVVTAWHVIDWLKNDPLYKSSPALKQSVDLLQNDPTLQICRDLCNAHKHAMIDRYIPTVSKVDPMENIYGEAIYGVATYGGPRTFVVKDQRGLHDVKNIMDTTVTLYETLFTTYGL